MSHAIQPAIWPEPGISTETLPYFRALGPVATSLTKGGVVFAPGGRLSTDTYFNLFNLGKWRSLCVDIPLALRLSGSGRFQLTVYLASAHQSVERIYSEPVQLGAETLLPLDLSDFDGRYGLLFFELIALTEGQLDDFAWVTTQAPVQIPQLVLSVTTFRREAAVAETAERFHRFREASDLRDHIRMQIVDNGRSVTIEPVEGVTIIPNENLGGAGGFTRGMLEARASGATHCLFMDDDASVHMGAVTRAWMLLAYARDPATAVGGAMINADHRWQIWENGAVFDCGCRAQFFATDLRERKQVFEMEFRTTDPAPEGAYAGWWFFAFPLDHATHLPFPFFVRGDDVSFSLANRFRLVTLPGVASIQESFIDKASPLTWYLDLRSHLAHHLSLPEKSVSWGRLQRMILNFYLRTVLRFHYDSLSAVNLAIEDVLRGPEFFAAHADMAQRRKDIRELTVSEAWQPVDRAATIRHGRLSRPMRALLLATLNGHLLPFANMLGSHLVIEAPERENFREVYGAREITYQNSSRTAAYTLRRDRRRFWSESLRLLRNCWKMCKNYQKLRLDWQGSYSDLTSEQFWQQKLRVASSIAAAAKPPNPTINPE